jgi:3-oxoacyl-[acyl-carrier protein] reductase
VNRASFDFTGASVVVTGGTSGLGHAVAGAFATAGATVTVTGTRASADEYDTDLGAFAFHQCDLRDGASVDRFVASLGDVDFLVNNAGAYILGAQDEWQPDLFLQSVELNLVGPMRLAVGCHDRLAASAASGGGAVVNISSLAALRTVPELPGYSSAKAGLLALTMNLARRWVGDGIRVNAVVPGLIATPMSKAVSGKGCLMGRAAMPHEVAAAVLYLCSDAATYVTGASLVVDGGNATR